MQALARLERLDNALMETERLMPPVPHLARRVVEDIEFQGHVLRPKEFVFCSISGTHRDPEIFADPDKFDPCRFAPPRSERRGQPLALAGFSVGARRCLGALLAQVSIKVLVHHILRGFVISAERDSYPSVYRPVLRPTGPMTFRVQART
jgi:cytochrome P450